MADVQEVRETTTTKNVDVGNTGVDDGQNIAARVISLIAGIVIALLAFRFVLSLLGANRNNGFADFIYSVTYPFVAPFFTLFNYNPVYNGVGKFETYTLVAMVVYAVVAWGLIKIVTINRRDTV